MNNQIAKQLFNNHAISRKQNQGILHRECPAETGRTLNIISILYKFGRKFKKKLEIRIGTKTIE